jgi:hypothetical protein
LHDPKRFEKEARARVNGESQDTLPTLANQAPLAPLAPQAPSFIEFPNGSIITGEHAKQQKQAEEAKTKDSTWFQYPPEFPGSKDLNMLSAVVQKGLQTSQETPEQPSYIYLKGHAPAQIQPEPLMFNEAAGEAQVSMPVMAPSHGQTCSISTMQQDPSDSPF